MIIFRSTLSTLAVYRDHRMLCILGLGFASGLPLLLVFSTLSFWLKQVGLDKSTIGLFALLSTPYTLKFLWSPLIDHVYVPGLHRWLGHRRSWLLVLQVLLAVAICAAGQVGPDRTLEFAILIFVVAFLSASQDIVIDALRIELLDDQEQAAGAASLVLTYRIGMLTAGAGAIALSDFIPWSTVYAIMAGLMGVGMVTTVFTPEPVHTVPEPVSYGQRLRTAVVGPFLEFLHRFSWKTTGLIVAFAVLYKYGDAVMGAMAKPFYVELGFPGLEVGVIVGGFGIAMTVLGGLLGGAWAAHSGLFPVLLLGGVLQGLTNLLFAALALIGPSTLGLGVVVALDNIMGGLATAGFVAFLSTLCNRTFTATQFALLSSLSATGRTWLSSGSGYLAEATGWPLFFILTTLLAIPGLMLLLSLRRRGLLHP